MTSNGTAAPIRVLVVDDEDGIRRTLRQWFERGGYVVLDAASAGAALEVVRLHRPDLMLLDIRMPGISGVDAIPQLLEVAPDLAIVMLSGAGEPVDAALAIQRGALDYLDKPVDFATLEATVTRALKRRALLTQDRELSAWLKNEVTRRTRELELAKQQLEEVSVATLAALVAALEARSAYWAGHSERVAAIAATIAAQMGLGESAIEQIRTAGRLHDIGVIGVPDAVLGKEGRLTDAEFRQIRDHTAVGARILAPLKHLGAIREFVRSHHERWDGQGYPDGLVAAAIPVGARIIHAAETFDALTTQRPYHRSVAPPAAVAEMRELAGSVFDPAVVAALESAVGRRQTLEFLATELPPGDVEGTDARSARGDSEDGAPSGPSS
jgi:putative two-component system response regulator